LILQRHCRLLDLLGNTLPDGYDRRLPGSGTVTIGIDGRVLMGAVVRIDQTEVSRIGNAVFDSAGRLERIAGEVDRCGADSYPAVEGSAALGATANYAIGWRDTLTDLAGQVHVFGDDLHKAAGDYHQTDAEAAAELNPEPRYS
jgi:hypothetical protein